MFRRASSVFMPSDADKAARAHEKKMASAREDLLRQAKLAERRAIICNTANNTLPRFDKPDIPDTPLARLNTDSTYNFPQAPPREHSPSMSIEEDERRFETPFKAAKRYNPLEEKKKSAEDEEKRLIHLISAEQNVNLSQAKVILAHNPSLRKSPLLRTASAPAAPSVSQARKAFSVQPEVSRIPVSPVPANTNSKAHKLMGIPVASEARTAPRQEPAPEEVQTPRVAQYEAPQAESSTALATSRRLSTGLGFVRTEPASAPENRRESFGKLETAPLTIRRPPLHRIAASTSSIDTTLVRPMSELYRQPRVGQSPMSTLTISTFGTSPKSPSRTFSSSPLSREFKPSDLDDSDGNEAYTARPMRDRDDLVAIGTSPKSPAYAVGSSGDSYYSMSCYSPYPDTVATPSSPNGRMRFFRRDTEEMERQRQREEDEELTPRSVSVARFPVARSPGSVHTVSSTRSTDDEGSISVAHQVEFSSPNIRQVERLREEDAMSEIRLYDVAQHV